MVQEETKEVASTTPHKLVYQNKNTSIEPNSRYDSSPAMQQVEESKGETNNGKPLKISLQDYYYNQDMHKNDQYRSTKNPSEHQK